MTAINTPPAGYGLRNFPRAYREEQANRSPVQRRKILTLKDSASLFVVEGHDCSKVNTDHSVVKVTARFFFSLFRFSVAYTWECNTMRGTTHYNVDSISLW